MKYWRTYPFAIAYLNDIIYSKTAEEHLKHLQQVFHRLSDAQLSMKSSKCHFSAKKIQYLGHVLSTTGIKPLLSKTSAIKLMKPLKIAKQVRAFPGLVGYYCKFIKNFAEIAKPYTALTHHNMRFAWTSGHHAAFNTLKSTLIEAPILNYPDSSKHYIVYTDASDDTCGAQLSQDTMAKSCQLHFSPKHSQTSKGNGALLNRKPMGFLCHNKVELLFTGICHYCMQQPQTPTDISEW